MKKQLMELAEVAESFEKSGNVHAGWLINQAMKIIVAYKDPKTGYGNSSDNVADYNTKKDKEVEDPDKEVNERIERFKNRFKKKSQLRERWEYDPEDQEEDYYEVDDEGTGRDENLDFALTAKQRSEIISDLAKVGVNVQNNVSDDMLISLHGLMEDELDAQYPERHEQRYEQEREYWGGQAEAGYPDLYGDSE